MKRNMDWRVEVMVPISDDAVHTQILDDTMVATLNDTEQSWVLGADGSYMRLKEQTSLPAFNVHTYFMNNPTPGVKAT